METWKDIDGYDGVYQISDHGRVRSFKRAIVILLGQCINKPNGYPIVILSSKEQNTYLVHRLVAQHFITNEHFYPVVNHMDGNKQNNHYQNLEWCTHKQNKQHAILTGLTPKLIARPENSIRGKAAWAKKLRKEDIITIRKAATVCKIKDIAKDFNVSYSTIRDIIIGKIWNHI